MLPRRFRSSAPTGACGAGRLAIDGRARRRIDLGFVVTPVSPAGIRKDASYPDGTHQSMAQPTVPRGTDHGLIERRPTV
jgi:hypothetical protein